MKERCERFTTAPRRYERMMWTACPSLLFGYDFQLLLLLVFLGEHGQAGQRRVYILDSQQTLGRRGEGLAVVEKHPNRLGHVPLEETTRR